MKNILNTSLIIVSLSSSLSLIAQQTPHSNVYAYNKYSLNPAYAGASGCTEISFSHLNQWVKVEGAPVTSLFSANTRIGKSLGIGGSLLVDKLGMLQQVAASGSLAYGFTIAKKHNLRFGITGGYYQFRINPIGAIVFDAQDVIVNGGSQSSSSINSELGFLYQFAGLELSLSSKQVVQTFSNFGYTGLDGYGLRRHMVGLLGYKFQVNQKLSIKPSVLYKGINNTNQFDMNVDASYKNFLMLGLGYRTQVGLIGRVGLNIQNLFFIGYAYEVPMQNIAKYSSGSHEIIIGLKLCKKKKTTLDSLLVDVADVAVEKRDTVYSVEYKTDTLIVERLDTIYINQPNDNRISDVDAKRVLDLAARKLEFENDKAIILKKSYGELESLTNLMLIREDLRIRLDGHTDNNGTEEYNLLLSKNRVQAVKDMLVSNGVDPSRIDIYYYGESNPIADNSTDDGKARNRRVEMNFIK